MTDEEIEEIRLRANSKIVLTANGKTYQSRVNADFSDIEYLLGVVSRNSLYAVNDTIVKGYIAYEGGIRVGLAGEYVYVNGKIKTIKNC